MKSLRLNSCSTLDSIKQARRALVISSVHFQRLVIGFGVMMSSELSFSSSDSVSSLLFANSLIALFVASGFVDAFLNLLFQYLSLLNIFFNGWIKKCWVTPHCLCSDSSTLRHFLPGSLFKKRPYVSLCPSFHYVETF